MKLLGLDEFTESNKIWRMICAEFVGTFFLVFIGCGTIMYVESSILVVQVALTFGFIIAAMAQVGLYILYFYVKYSTHAHPLPSIRRS